MLVTPDWDKFKSKFSDNPQKAFEWFCYLLFCREFGLEKGWMAFHNQSAIETEPASYDGEIIGFQSKFYVVPLSSKKAEMEKMLKGAKKNYPALTKIQFYTNQKWAKGKTKNGKLLEKSQAQTEIEAEATKLRITIEWRTHSFFESEFVANKNSDLARYFFSDQDFLGWRRFTDWSSKKSDIDAEYFIDEYIKIITPNNKLSDAVNIIEGINHIRQSLSKPGASVRLVGLSGVGKTRLAQALFDKRVGDEALDIRNVWYCDVADSPNPSPSHFIEMMSSADQQYIIIVDNCGQEQHSILTNLVQEHKNFAIMTIEYDVSDDLPKETNVYKMQPTTTGLLEKVIKRHFPEILDANVRKIAENSGGNYRLALAIASNIEKTENLSVLTDNELFKRLFYQKGNLDNEELRVAKIFSLVFSFNVEDQGNDASEIELLAIFAEVSVRQAYRIIESFHQRDIVQSRGEYRAILPHALANTLAKQALKTLSVNDINSFFKNANERLKASFLKRISYLHDENKIIPIVKEWFKPENYLGNLILNTELTYSELRKIELLSWLYPDEILGLLHIRSQSDKSLLSTANPEYYTLARLLAHLAYFERNFKQAFWMLFEIVKTEEYGTRTNSTKDILVSLFNYHLSQTETSFMVKKDIINQLFADPNNQQYLLDILDHALTLHVGGIVLRTDDNGIKTIYSYQPKTYSELWDWFEFLLEKLYQLDSNIDFTQRCRQVFSQNLRDIVCQCGKTEPVFKYVKKFHDDHPFEAGLLAIKRILKYEGEQLKEQAPEILEEIIRTQSYLSPNIRDVSLLLKTYVLHEGYYDYKSDLGEEFAFSIHGFKNYEELITYISNNLTQEILHHNLQGLIGSSDYLLENIGKKAILVYGSINDFILDIEELSKLENLPISVFFLRGVFKTLLTRNIKDYYQLIEYLFKNKHFSKNVPYLMAQASNTQEHFDEIIKMIPNYPEANFIYLGEDLASKKFFGEITNQVFESTLDKLIAIQAWEVVKITLVCECLRNSTLNDKYIDTLLGLLSNIIDTERDFYRYAKAFDILLKYSDNTQKEVFKIVTEAINSLEYVYSLSNTALGHILEHMLKVSPLNVIDLIYENEKFSHILINGDFRHAFSKVDNNSVLEWVGTDQNKIDFWLSNSKLYTSENNNYNWNSLIIDLLNASSNSEKSLIDFVASQILRLRGWAGEMSNAMQQRLIILENLGCYLEQNNFSHLKLTINRLGIAYQKKIDAEIENELKESKERNRFEW